MIQQEHLEPFPTPEKGTGKTLTIPGLSVDVKQALIQYQRGSLENKAIGYYESKGMNAPDFSRMSKIERLVALGEYRELVSKTTNDLDTFAAAKAARDKEQIKLNKDESNKKAKDE